MSMERASRISGASSSTGRQAVERPHALDHPADDRRGSPAAGRVNHMSISFPLGSSRIANTTYCGRVIGKAETKELNRASPSYPEGNRLFRCSGLAADQVAFGRGVAGRSPPRPPGASAGASARSSARRSPACRGPAPPGSRASKVAGCSVPPLTAAATPETSCIGLTAMPWPKAMVDGVDPRATGSEPLARRLPPVSTGDRRVMPNRAR